jgi:hypothetical protein
MRSMCLEDDMGEKSYVGNIVGADGSGDANKCLVIQQGDLAIHFTNALLKFRFHKKCLKVQILRIVHAGGRNVTGGISTLLTQ